MFHNYFISFYFNFKNQPIIGATRNLMSNETEGTVLFGKYVIQQKLSQKTFVATEIKNSRTVLIEKIKKTRIQESERKYFSETCEHHLKIKHPNLLNVLNFEKVNFSS
jgi:hypothetical protein